MANEIVRDTISKIRYMLHVMSLHKVGMCERAKTFKWHFIATQFRPIAHILVQCVLNNSNMCPTIRQIVRSIDHAPFAKVSLYQYRVTLS